MVTCGVFLPAGNVSLTISFVYGFNLVEERTTLWEELVHISSTTPVSSHPWAVLGDFNQIMRSSQHSDHQSRDIDISGMDEMNLALQDAELFEAQAKGLIFSWWNCSDGHTISKKIDHALINQQWATDFPDAYAEFLDPKQSDHTPIWFCVPSLKRLISRPFQFFHHVIDHPEYCDVVRQSWQCNQVSGLNQFKVLKSLKALKPALRRLNKRYYSGISQHVKIVESQLDELHRTILSAPTPELAREEHLIRAKWRLLSKAEEKFYRQRSRVKWMHLGNRNTEFFHKTVSVRLNRNHIHFLQDQSGRRISGDSDLKSYAAAYFEEILGTTSMPESPCSTSVLTDILSFCCSDIHKLSLIKAVSVEEITSTVFALSLDKCPGPDGYSVEFFRASWSIVGSDIVAAVQEFFRNGRLLKDFNTTKIALIPKFPEACKLGDYRPISCCNLVYKII